MFRGCAQVLCVSRRHSLHVERVLPAFASSRNCQVAPHVMVTKTRPQLSSTSTQKLDGASHWAVGFCTDFNETAENKSKTTLLLSKCKLDLAHLSAYSAEARS